MLVAQRSYPMLLGWAVLAGLHSCAGQDVERKKEEQVQGREGNGERSEMGLELIEKE
jgi:hypothetical protein